MRQIRSRRKLHVGAMLLGAAALAVLLPSMASAQTGPAPAGAKPFLTVDGKQPLVIGHRGVPGLVPEETEASYELAADLGTDALEEDLHLTKDCVLVARLARDGPNLLSARRGASWLRKLAEQFVQPLVVVLLGAAALSIALGDYVDAAVIGAVGTLNGLIGFFQEYRAEQSIAALSKTIVTEATVLRDGTLRRVPSAELVRGDVVVLQSGEDPGLTRDFVGGVIREIKATTGLAVTLSLGERSDDDYRAWRETGADRVLLQFETSDARLYAAIHPSLPGRPSDRIAQLRRLRSMGFEIGGGVMVGLPGQTWDTLANDVLAFREYDMDMIGLGPYIPSPGTPLHGAFGATLRQ